MKPVRQSRIPAGGEPTAADLRRREKVREARKLIRAGKPAEALPLLRPLERKARHDADLLFMLAIAYDAVMATKQAGECAERSHKLAPHPQKLLIAAQSYRREGETDRAIAMCDRVVEKFPKMLRRPWS